MTAPFLSTANRNCPMRRFLRKKSSLGYFVQETPRMYMGVSQERNCLLNIVSQKQYLMTIVLPLCYTRLLEVPPGTSFGLPVKVYNLPMSRLCIKNCSMVYRLYLQRR